MTEFGRYNLIYGWNWSGKTTLSQLFRDLEKRRPPERGDVVLRIHDHHIRGEDFRNSTVQIRVFNRAFIEENVFPIERDEIPPIFVLGAKSVEKQRKIEDKRSELARLQSNLEHLHENRNSAVTEFDSFCKAQAKDIKFALRSSGANPYSNYNKSTFQDRANKMLRDGDRNVHRLNESARDSLLSRLKATPKQKVKEVEYTFPDFDSISKRVSKLLDTTVVSKVIETLKEDRTLGSWVRQGLAIHRDRSATICQFCEQSLPEDRIAALEGHFSDRYERFIQELEQQIDELRRLITATDQLRPPHKADLHDDLISKFEASEMKLNYSLASAKKWLDTAVCWIESKKTLVFDQVRLEVEIPKLDASTVARMNEVIREHNRACDDFENRVAQAREQLAASMTEENLDDFVAKRNAAQSAKKRVQEKEAEVQRLNDDIERLEAEILEHRRPAQELSADLCSYLGHSELSLEARETGYTITRGDVPAKSLSEGETTAIALLYFLKTLQDKNFNLTAGIVVIDDPVSSLDANALFLAFGFIRERTQDARQLFVLTHNFSFFRQIRNWLKYIGRQNRRDSHTRSSRFFMLHCEHNEGLRGSSIRPLDPLLKQFDSEYHYLFAQSHQAATEATTESLDRNYELPNMARRMLEAFLAFRLPHISGTLQQKLDSIEFDNAKKYRILRFLHTHSHSIGIGEPEHDLTALVEAKPTLKDLMDMIRSQDPEHHKAMLELVSSSGDKESF